MATYQTKSKDYDEFVEKFKPKLTTDDCYTPPEIYGAVSDFVRDAYGVDPSNFVRPFWPGSDYTTMDYTDKIVVDNPPFSITGKILNYFNAHGVKYFIFCNGLTSFNHLDKCDVVIINTDIIYMNGAKVRTAFYTNLVNKRGDYKVYYAEDLDAAIKATYPNKVKPRTPRPANYWSFVDCIKSRQSIPRDDFVKMARKTPDGLQVFGCAAVAKIFRNE